MMLEQKQHFSIKVETVRSSWNSYIQDFMLVLRIFLAFSLFSQGFFCSVTFVEHMIINLSCLKSCWAVTGKKHKPGKFLPRSQVYVWGSCSFRHSAPHFFIIMTMFLHWHALPHCLLLHRPYSISSLNVSGIFSFISLFMLVAVAWLVSDWAPVRRR